MITLGNLVHLFTQKLDAFDAIETFVNMAKVHFEKQVKTLRSDNTLEFDDKKCKPFFAKLGIVHQTSCVDTPQKNVRVERRYRNILEMARALRFQAGLPLHFWGDCVHNVVHITNILPSPVIGNISPYEALHKIKPKYNHLKSFGCLAMASNPTSTKDKFQPKRVPCVFIGYPANKKGYRLHNLLTGIIFVFRNVRFYE